MSALTTVTRELPVPGSVLRALAARFPDRYPMLMDSAAEGPLSRFSILAAEPRAALWLDADGSRAYRRRFSADGCRASSARSSTGG